MTKFLTPVHNKTDLKLSCLEIPGYTIGDPAYEGSTRVELYCRGTAGIIGGLKVYFLNSPLTCTRSGEPVTQRFDLWSVQVWRRMGGLLEETC